MDPEVIDRFAQLLPLAALQLIPILFLMGPFLPGLVFWGTLGAAAIGWEAQ